MVAGPPRFAPEPRRSEAMDATPSEPMDALSSEPAPAPMAQPEGHDMSTEALRAALALFESVMAPIEATLKRSTAAPSPPDAEQTARIDVSDLVLPDSPHPVEDEELGETTLAEDSD
jgi:hypothetical protein